MLTKTDIEKYFFAEKQENLFFLIIGVMAILIAITFYFFVKNNFYRGAAIPFLVVGLIQLVVGYTVYTRSDQQRIDNVYAFDMNPGKLKNEELPRMKAVGRSFIVYRWIEIVLVLAGITLIFYFSGEKEKSFWLGFGFALAVQAALMLSADYFAQKRGKVYTEQLENYTQKP